MARSLDEPHRLQFRGDSGRQAVTWNAKSASMATEIRFQRRDLLLDWCLGREVRDNHAKVSGLPRQIG